VPWRKSFLYQNYRDPAYPKVTFDVLAVRSASHKYVENDHNTAWTQLFDLQADPGENHNLARDPVAAELLTRMQAELARLKVETDFVPPPPGKRSK
jgi:arylsulfatase A-like enzyme